MATVSSITLYRDTNFHGATPLTFTADGPLTISNLKDDKFNDCTSSIIVKGPGTWIAYQNTNCGGDKWTLTQTGGVNGTGSYPDPSYWRGKNDSISSLQYIPNAQ